MPGFLQDLDNRKELWSMLGRVRHEDRLRFLRHCCSICTEAILPVKADPKTRGERDEVYWDVLMLEAMHRLDLNKAMPYLLALLRNREVPDASDLGSRRTLHGNLCGR